MSNLKQYTIESFIIWFSIAGTMEVYIGGQFKRLSKKSFEKLPNNVRFDIEGQTFIKTGNIIKGI